MRGPHRRSNLDRGRPAPGRRSTALATVPDLVGLELSAAHDAALDAELLAVVVGGDHRADRGGLGAGYQVIGQDPDPGLCLARGHRIRVWVRRRPAGGPAGSGPDDDGGGDGPGGMGRGRRPQPVIPSGTK